MITTILQPAFLPWLGYLAMIEASDIFVFYDDVQFFRWFVNRNKIKVQGKESWLTVPVQSHRDLINQTKIAYTDNWIDHHLEKLRHAYTKAANFKEGFALARDIYQKFDTIGELAVHSSTTLCQYLGIKTRLLLSSDLNVVEGDKTERLVNICYSLGTSVYLTGYGSDGYIEPQKFENRGIHMLFYKYEQKPHHQVGEKFLPYMSSLDAIMNCSKEEVLSLVRMRKVLKVQPELT